MPIYVSFGYQNTDTSHDRQVERVSGRDRVRDFFGYPRGKGLRLISGQDLEMMGLSDRILAVHFGRPIALGTPVEVADHPEVRKDYLGV